MRLPAKANGESSTFFGSGLSGKLGWGKQSRWVAEASATRDDPRRDGKSDGETVRVRVETRGPLGDSEFPKEMRNKFRDTVQEIGNE